MFAVFLIKTHDNCRSFEVLSVFGIRILMQGPWLLFINDCRLWDGVRSNRTDSLVNIGSCLAIRIWGSLILRFLLINLIFLSKWNEFLLCTNWWFNSCFLLLWLRLRWFDLGTDTLTYRISLDLLGILNWVSRLRSHSLDLVLRVFWLLWIAVLEGWPSLGNIWIGIAPDDSRSINRYLATRLDTYISLRMLQSIYWKLLGRLVWWLLAHQRRFVYNWGYMIRVIII
jgi:hypothetical protein